MILNLILLGVIIFLLIVLSMIWPPDSPWAPWWRTNRRIARAICKLGKVNNKDIIYDLGSGDGEALIIAASEFGAKGVGIEIDPLRTAVSATRIKLEKVTKNVRIVQKNFFDVPINDATVVFVYLVPKALKRLQKKFEKELKPGVRIVSYRYRIPYLPLLEHDELHELYLYKIPSKRSTKKK